MVSSYNLSHLDNDTSLRELTRLIDHGRQHEAKILAHIAEVDSRRLYAEAAYSSMFAYCVDALHLSEAASFRRITAARAARRFPVLLEKVASGELHLCAIKLLAPYLTGSNCARLVALATHLSKRKLEAQLAALFPREPVKESVRKLPVRREPTARTRVATPAAQSQAPTPTSTATVALVLQAGMAAKRPRDTIDALCTDRYKVQFTASGALRSKIDRAKELLPVGASDLASIFERALDSLIVDLERKRFGAKRPGKTSKRRSESLVPGPATNSDAPKTKKRSRTIARAVRRAIAERDGGQCTFARADGKRCSERHGLEFHHLQPFAHGGQSTVQNLTLRCKTHNLYAAERDFGIRAIDKFRCREPVAAYGASLGSTRYSKATAL